jgi:hypothetical protein
MRSHDETLTLLISLNVQMVAVHEQLTVAIEGLHHTAALLVTLARQRLKDDQPGA